MKKWFSRVVVALGYAYPLFVLVLALGLGLVGDDWWVTSMAAYLPRALFLLPAPLLAYPLFRLRRLRLFWLQLATALLVVFPLMGFVLPSWPSSRQAGQKTLRVLSYNVDSQRAGQDVVAREIFERDPELVLLQEVYGNDEFFALLRGHFPHLEISSQFVIASRFPISAAREADPIPYGGRERHARSMRYVVESPLGPLVIYAIHPVSPRENFYALRGRGGLRSELLSGRLLLGEAAPTIYANNGLRALQIADVAAHAGRESGPFLIAGDTNLAGLDPLLRRHFGQFKDGFREAGFGFGYTFPQPWPWMRLDRMLASRELEFLEFGQGCVNSDHRCIWAEITRAK